MGFRKLSKYIRGEWGVGSVCLSIPPRPWEGIGYETWWVFCKYLLYVFVRFLGRGTIYSDLSPQRLGHSLQKFNERGALFVPPTSLSFVTQSFPQRKIAWRVQSQSRLERSFILPCACTHIAQHTIPIPWNYFKPSRRRGCTDCFFLF